MLPRTEQFTIVHLPSGRKSPAARRYRNLPVYVNIEFTKEHLPLAVWLYARQRPFFCKPLARRVRIVYCDYINYVTLELVK